MDMEFLFLDMNQCPIAIGNPDPNRFADTARCKKSTTQVILYYVFAIYLLLINCIISIVL